MKRAVSEHVLLHFHPDWPYRNTTVLDGMVSSGRYVSQFETGTSNGGLTAHPGGDRWNWESRLFDGRYDSAPASARPVYGAIDLGNDYGSAPRFGSAFLRLRHEVSHRATYCYPDSVFEPDGVVGMDGVSTLIDQMRSDDLDPLDRYVEAHVHGGVVFATDVEAIVLDPCYRGTAVQSAAELLSEVTFHRGFRVETAALDPRYRGAQYSELAASLAGELTPELLGIAARSQAHTSQSLKKVWHLLARYGRRD
ncbi:DUF3626 domain-containing protein [Agreia bicolorata]|uniref:DUF3626 domain-containing protein n=1 Tax=Agreia bicolorata TaxID=110935 RepID=A0ABR5CFN4_9MICO|nr:DUF3626 domain-containing protein [Agreia bicolorata]KJC64427.1 hypothetical protein TZ00_08370 [Agreia bicolorata]